MSKSNLLATMLMVLGIIAVSVEAITMIVDHVSKLDLLESDYEIDVSGEDEMGY